LADPLGQGHSRVAELILQNGILQQGIQRGGIIGTLTTTDDAREQQTDQRM